MLLVQSKSKHSNATLIIIRRALKRNKKTKKERETKKENLKILLNVI